MGCGTYLDELSPFHVERPRVFVVLSRSHARLRAYWIMDRWRGRYGSLYMRFVLQRSAGSIPECEATPGDPHRSFEQFDDFISK